MYKYLIIAILLISCKDKEPKSTEEKLSIEEWKKANLFNDSFKIDSLGLTALYTVVEEKDDYRVLIDFCLTLLLYNKKRKKFLRKRG